MSTFETRVMSDKELDAIELPDDVVSIPNPNQIGTKDQWLVGHVSDPVIKAFRIKMGVELEG